MNRAAKGQAAIALLLLGAACAVSTACSREPTGKQKPDPTPEFPSVTDKCPAELSDAMTRIGQPESRIKSARGRPDAIMKPKRDAIDDISIYRHKYWQSLQYGDLMTYRAPDGGPWSGHRVGRVEFFDIDSFRRVVGYRHFQLDIPPNQKPVGEAAPWSLGLEPEVVQHAGKEHGFAEVQGAKVGVTTHHVRAYYRCEDKLVEIRAACVGPDTELEHCNYEGLLVHDIAAVYRSASKVRSSD